MLRRIVATGSSWATVPLRAGLGAIFIAHGAQKVLGSFGGPGFRTFTSFPAPFSFMRPAWLWMGAAALSELLGGVMILIGLLTRAGAFLIACTMLTAIIGVHWPAFFANNKGFEYPLALLAGSLALLIYGGGQASVDRMIGARGGRRRY